MGLQLLLRTKIAEASFVSSIGWWQRLRLLLQASPVTISTSYDYDSAPILAFLHKPQSERDALMLANPPIDEDSEDSDIDEDEWDY